MFNGVSLNGELLIGEVPQINVIGVLLRLREFSIALGGDITNKFPRLCVHEEDAFIYLSCIRPRVIWY